mgnify:CR=1 FL=1
MIKRREFNGLLSGLGLGAWALAGPAQAQGLNKTVRILVGFPPGGSADILARMVADALRDDFGTIIVDNKPGAGGRIALEQLKNAEADGSVLAVTPASMMVPPPMTPNAMALAEVATFWPRNVMSPPPEVSDVPDCKFTPEM